MNYSVTSSKDNRTHVVEWDDGVNATVNGSWEQATKIGRSRSISTKMQSTLRELEQTVERIRNSVNIMERATDGVWGALAAMETL